MMMTLLSEASFLGFEGIEATFFKALICGLSFGVLFLYGALCKDMTKTDIGEKICSILAWVGGIAGGICCIIGIVYAIKIF